MTVETEPDVSGPPTTQSLPTTLPAFLRYWHPGNEDPARPDLMIILHRCGGIDILRSPDGSAGRVDFGDSQDKIARF